MQKTHYGGAPVGNTNATINGRTAVSLSVRLNAATATYIKSIPPRKGRGLPKTIVTGELYESGLRARDAGAEWLTEPTRSHIGALRLSVQDRLADDLRALPADGSRAAKVGRLLDLGLWIQQRGEKIVGEKIEGKTAVSHDISHDGCISYEPRG